MNKDSGRALGLRAANAGMCDANCVGSLVVVRAMMTCACLLCGVLEKSVNEKIYGRALHAAPAVTSYIGVIE